MTAAEILADLEAHGNPGMKAMLMKHGVTEPFFGVKVEYLKTLQKKIRKDYQLAKNLFDTGNSDAQYLAGMIADDQAMTAADLQHWATSAISKNVVEYTVPWVVTGSKHALELSLSWIDSDNENLETIGWNALSGWLALTPDEQIDLTLISNLLQRVEQEIHQAKNRVRYCMNGFIIAVGCYLTPLSTQAKLVASRVGAPTVYMNGTSCKVPNALGYIIKAEAKGNVGKKKKTVKC